MESKTEREVMDAKLRRAVLNRDGHECQLSKLFGITELSGKPCSEDLEVHHISYERFGHESKEDLIAVCARCHDILTSAIRQERYAARRTLLTDSRSITGLCPGSRRKGKVNERENEVSTDGSCPVDNAQREDGRPERPVLASDEGDFVEAQLKC